MDALILFMLEFPMADKLKVAQKMADDVTKWALHELEVHD